MNFFFGFTTNTYETSLIIPNFTNYKHLGSNLNVCCGFIKNNKWFFEVLKNLKNDDFFVVEPSAVTNSNIFFLASDKEIQNFNKHNNLVNINHHTDTYPEFRCNLEVKKKNGGFSSYQSEYSYSMTKVKGGVVSSLLNLTQRNQKNLIIFRNIYHEPIIKKFFGYMVEKDKKKIIKKISLYTNTSNIINFDDELLEKNTYFCTKEYIGIPVYLSDLNGHLSFEHTHPPQTYINDNTKKYVSDYKNKLLSVIKYETSPN